MAGCCPKNRTHLPLDGGGSAAWPTGLAKLGGGAPSHRHLIFSSLPPIPHPALPARGRVLHRVPGKLIPAPSTPYYSPPISRMEMGLQRSTVRRQSGGLCIVNGGWVRGWEIPVRAGPRKPPAGNPDAPGRIASRFLILRRNPPRGFHRLSKPGGFYAVRRFGSARQHKARVANPGVWPAPAPSAADGAWGQCRVLGGTVAPRALTQ